MVGVRVKERSQDETAARFAVVELAVVALGKLAVAGPRGKMNANEREEMRQCLFDCLEVLNNEKENY